jgi:hypothetical protein
VKEVFGSKAPSSGSSSSQNDLPKQIFQKATSDSEFKLPSISKVPGLFRSKVSTPMNLSQSKELINYSFQNLLPLPVESIQSDSAMLGLNDSEEAGAEQVVSR